MVQEYVSPIRVHKFPFEMVMAVSTLVNCNARYVSLTEIVHTESVLFNKLDYIIILL